MAFRSGACFLNCGFFLFFGKFLWFTCLVFYFIDFYFNLFTFCCLLSPICPSFLTCFTNKKRVTGAFLVCRATRKRVTGAFSVCWEKNAGYQDIFPDNLLLFRYLLPTAPPHYWQSPVYTTQRISSYTAQGFRCRRCSNPRR